MINSPFGPGIKEWSDSVDGENDLEAGAYSVVFCR